MFSIKHTTSITQTVLEFQDSFFLNDNQLGHPRAPRARLPYRCNGLLRPNPGKINSVTRS